MVELVVRTAAVPDPPISAIKKKICNIVLACGA
jgi:hypothetical protein